VDIDDTDSDESNPGDEVMFDDPPENHDSENARAYIGALNWLRGVPGAQHGTGYSDVDPTVHEERAAELPRYLAWSVTRPGCP
jgi:hypothetical protein